MKNLIKFLSAVFFVCLIGGCADKYTELYNLTPDQWYSEIIGDIKNRDLESADKHYTAMSSEHVASPLLEQILLILAQAHAQAAAEQDAAGAADAAPAPTGKTAKKKS